MKLIKCFTQQLEKKLMRNAFALNTCLEMFSFD